MYLEKIVIEEDDEGCVIIDDGEGE